MKDVIEWLEGEVFICCVFQQQLFMIFVVLIVFCLVQVVFQGFEVLGLKLIFLGGEIVVSVSGDIFVWMQFGQQDEGWSYGQV